MATRGQRALHTVLRHAGLADCTVHRATAGESGAEVYRVVTPDNAILFLKFGTGAIGEDITAETERLRWTATHLVVPHVVSAGQVHGMTYQLTTALAGESAYTVMTREPATAVPLVREIAHVLHQLHRAPVASCPFDASFTRRLQDARRNIDAGRVDVDDFDDCRAGWTAEQVWHALHALLPLAIEPAVTHGDFSLDNIIVDDGRVTGCIDVGRLGVADRYQDLAILWNTLAEFGESAQQALFDAYGITSPDERRLQFHLLLDELF